MKITDTLQQEKNSATGNTFYVVGESDDVKASIRFWKEGSMPGRTMLAFRIRLTPKIDVLHFTNYLNAKWPDVVFTGHGVNHVSVAGGTGYNAHSKNVEAIIGLAEDNDIAGKLFDLIETSFPGLSVAMDRGQFAGFYQEQILLALDTIAPVSEVGASVVLEFSKYKQKFEHGKAIDSDASDAANCGL